MFQLNFQPEIATSRRRGFTLIEILVVIAVIGILTAIVYVNFSQAKAQSRDKYRMAQLDQLRVALELYKDKYGSYPVAGCGSTEWTGPAPELGTATWYTSCPDYITGLVPEFMDELPRNPIEPTTGARGIMYRTAGSGASSYYTVLYGNVVEVLTIPNDLAPYARYPDSCPGTTPATTYAVYSPGGRCG